MSNREALKERNNSADISHFQCSFQLIPGNQGRRAARLPLAFIFRAVGAAPDSAPLALRQIPAPLALRQIPAPLALGLNRIPSSRGAYRLKE